MAVRLWSELVVPKRQRERVEQEPESLVESEPWEGVFAQLCGRLGKGYTVVLHGKNGNGKTQLGVCVLKRACERGMSGKFTDAISLFMRLRETYRDGGPRETEVVRSFLAPAVLIIDEAHERAESAWENRTLTHIINKRYEDMKDTILITNEEEREAAVALGRSITNRMLESGAFIHCNWPSFRGQ